MGGGVGSGEGRIFLTPLKWKNRLFKEEVITFYA